VLISGSSEVLIWGWGLISAQTKIVNDLILSTPTPVTMRNLALSTVSISTLQAEDSIQFSIPTSEGNCAVLSAIAFDLDRKTVFAGTESSQGEILVWRTSDGTSSIPKNDSFVFCGSYNSPNARIANLRVLSESNQLVLVTLSGDIVVWELDESGGFSVSNQGAATLGLLTFITGGR
jgi:elongator complex protein 1